MAKVIWNRLHTHSHYSTRDAVAKVGDLVLEAKKRGCTALALTEHGNLSSSFELWRDARREGIKPILGLEGYYVDNYASEEANIPFNYSHIVILAMNRKGWQNLKNLHFASWRDGYLRVPRIDFELLKKYNDGLIISTACI